jgi:hypothetical protein
MKQEEESMLAVDDSCGVERGNGNRREVTISLGTLDLFVSGPIQPIVSMIFRRLYAIPADLSAMLFPNSHFRSKAFSRSKLMPVLPFHNMNLTCPDFVRAMGQGRHGILCPSLKRIGMDPMI